MKALFAFTPAGASSFLKVRLVDALLTFDMGGIHHESTDRQ